MITHKILIGANAGLYLPFGMSRLRALVAIYGTGPFQQKYRLPGFEVEVSQSLIERYVRVKAVDGLYFEFLTSGSPPVTFLTSSPDVGVYASYKPAAVGVNITLVDSTL